jgi:hypothetical protein
MPSPARKVSIQYTHYPIAVCIITYVMTNHDSLLTSPFLYWFIPQSDYYSCQVLLQAQENNIKKAPDDGPPKPPRTAFMCFSDAKSKEILAQQPLVSYRYIIAMYNLRCDVLVSLRVVRN